MISCLLSSKLNNPSKLAEMQELEHWKLKFDTAGAATEGYFSKRWVAENIFNVSEEEMIKNQKEIFFDKKFEISLEAVAEQESQEAAGDEGGLGDLGGDLGDLGGDEGGRPGRSCWRRRRPWDLGDLGGEEPEGGEDVILAEPAGKRDDPKLVKMKKDAFWKGTANHNSCI